MVGAASPRTVNLAVSKTIRSQRLSFVIKPSVMPASLWRFAKEYRNEFSATVVIEDESDRRCAGFMNTIVGDGMGSFVADKMSSTSFAGVAEEDVN
jgi:hypothetical protein